MHSRKAAFVTIATIFATLSGCCHFGSSGSGMIDTFMDKQVACMRDHVWAKRAFHLRYGHCERLHADHFRDGFVSGYRNVCKGGPGECPAVPPEKYWGFQYRTREGAEMQNAWFAGFEDGALAAKTDGTGTYRNIQISHRMTELIAETEMMRNSYAGLRKGTQSMGATWHNHNGQLVPESAFGTALADPILPMTPSGMYIPSQHQNEMAPMANTPVGIPSEMMLPPVMEESSGFYPPPVPVVGPSQVPLIPGTTGNR